MGFFSRRRGSEVRVDVLVVLVRVHLVFIGVAEALHGETVELNDAAVLQKARDQRQAAAEVSRRRVAPADAAENGHQYHRNDHARDLLFRVETLHGLLGDDALVDHGPGELLLYAEQAHGVEHARRHDEEGKQGNGRVEQQDGEACGLSVQENPSYSK